MEFLGVKMQQKKLKLEKILSKDVDKLHEFLDALFIPGDHVAFTRLIDGERKPPLTDIVIPYEKLKKQLTLEYIEKQKETNTGMFICPNPIRKGQRRADKN